MARVIEPLKQDKKLADEIRESGAKRVVIVFWHGLGDLVMFLAPYKKLKELFPDVSFTLAIQKGLGFEEVYPEAWFITGDDLNNLSSSDYDLAALVHFPMSEGQVEYTKAEWCCIHELGIPPEKGHFLPKLGHNRLVGVHFNITCLPDSCNPSRETAEMIWNDILEAGFIPIETHFQHVFHNPANAKFDFIDCTVRRAVPRISTLVGLIESCRAFIGVVSGNFHVALATKPQSRIFFLEKHFKLECFARLPVARASIKDGEYKHEVKDWLIKLDENGDA
jgi:hypothetical protein